MAGDKRGAAGDLELALVAIPLVYRKGYFRERLEDLGNQTEEPDVGEAQTRLQPANRTVTVSIEGREVKLQAWRYDITGMSGHVVTVYLLDSDFPTNSEWDRKLTDSLYAGDSRDLLCQDVLLGIRGIAMLRSLALDDINSYHMNEG